MKRGHYRNSRLSQKGRRVKREALGTFDEALSFLPGIGFAKTTYNTANRAVRTARATRDYADELYREAKRRVRKSNPFN